MPGLPSVQQVKLAGLRSSEPAPVVVSTPSPKPSAIASFAPGQRSAPAAPEAPLNEDDYVVGAQPAQPGVGPSAAPPEPAAPVEVVAPVAELSEEEKRAEKDKQWRESSPEMYHAYKTVAGMYERSKSDIITLKAELNNLKEEIKTLREAPPAPVASIVPASNIEFRDITPEEQERFGEAFPVINSLSAKASKQVIDEVVAPLIAQINELKEQTKQVSSTVQDTSESAFVNNVRSRVKNMDAIVRLPEWQEHLNKRVPYTGYTVGEALISAHKAHDLDRVQEIFDSFNSPENTNISELVTPTASTNRSPVTTQGQQKKMLAISHRMKASTDFRKKRISKDEFDKIETIYKKAESEGRIDYNA